MAIKDLSVNAVLHDEDRFPIYDVESGRTRSVLASTIKKYIDDHPSTDKFVQSGSYADGTLTLTYNDGSTINIPGFPDGGLEDHGTLGATQDPRNLAQGTYYVTEKFIDAPDYAPSGYVGLAVVQKGFDQGNGELVAYYNDDGVYYLKKDAAGWDTKWQYIPKAQDTLDSFYLSWNSDGPSYQVGNHVTLTPSRPVPAWADFIGMTYNLDKHTTDNGLASISGNIITLLKVGRIGFTAVSRESTAVVSGNIDITAASAPGSQPPTPLPPGQASSATGVYDSLNDSKVNDIKFTPNARDKTVAVDLVKNGNTVRADELDLSSFFSGKVAPTLALHFSGIYDELQDLKDAIPSPTENQQAIVLKPSEKYYHGVGGAWVELAPVGAFHPTYLGAYDTVDDLKAANPSPTDQALAIVGTTAKSFYIYTNSDWDQLTHTDLPSLDARITDLEPKVASNIHRLDVAEGHLQTLQTDVQKNVKDIAELAHVGKTFVYNGSAQPTWDAEAHGNHILTFRAMSQTLQLTPPSYTGGNPDGMIITIFNDDIDNAVRFQIPISTGGSNPNIPPENFASYVYNASTQNYTPMESGYIPVARINLANYIRNQLNSDGYLNTLQEIADDGFVKGMKVSGDAPTALNDMKWLHFNNAVVTEAKPGQADITITGVGNSIDAVVDGTTYKDKHVITFKGMHAVDGSGNQLELSVDPAETVLHFQTIASRDQWSASEGSKYTKVVCVVDRDDNGYVAWYEWDSSKWVDYNSQGVIMSDSNGAIPKNIKTVVFGPGFTIQQAGDQEDAALVTYQSTQDDGMTINGKHVSDLEVMAPLQIDSGLGTGGDARLLVDPRAYEEQHAASCLLQLDSDLTLQAGKASKLYTSHEIIPTGEYFSLNQFAGGVNVQDNTGGDTAVTGGELTRILGSVSFYGKATDNSNVKVWFWYKDPLSPLAGGILNDVNGNPMVVERYYNQGDDMSVPLVVAGAMMATGNAPIVMYVECSAGSYIVNPDQTLICIEQFSDGYETSLASIEFQRRLAIESHAEIKQFKTTMLSLKDELHTDVPEAVVPAHQGYDFINEFGVQNLSDIKASVSSSSLNISDNGNVTDFYVDVYIDNVKTTMLRGKTIDYDVVIKNPHDAYYLEVYKWTGKADSAGRIYDSRNNDSLVLNKGFTLLKSKFIAEHPAGDASDVTDSVSIPNDANNIFIILRPGAAQSPISLSLQDFKWGVATPFRGYLETSRVNLREQHLWFSESWAEFGLNAHDLGYAGIRYTINNTPSTGNPMPVGKLYKGKAPVEIDNTVNQVSGSADPQMDGGIKFLKDGEASISKSYNLWNEQGTENTVTFWDVLIDVDGNESKIPDSEKTFRVPANTGAPGVVYSIPAYVVEVETGQRVAGRATSSKVDGAYVQSQNITQMLVQTEIDFKELVQSGGDDPELINAAIPRAMVFDRRVYTFSGNSQQNIQIPLTIPADVELAEIEVVKHSGTTTTSIKDCEYAYDSSTNTLTVHVGNGVTDGKVYLSFWSGIA